MATRISKIEVFWVIALLCMATLFLPGCSSPKEFDRTKVNCYDDFAHNAQAMEKTITNAPFHFYPLEFDSGGHLMSYASLIRAKDEIESSWDPQSHWKTPINKIVVISFGWDHTYAEAEAAYKEWFDQYFKDTQCHGPATNNWLVFCVSWMSTPTGLNTLLNDYFVSPTVSDMVSWAPDHLTFPVTFWAKSALADRIGYHDLKYSIQYLFDNIDDATNRLSLYFIGHSFGCRILSGMASEKSTEGDQKQFSFLTRLRGGVFIQPAMAAPNLPKKESVKYNFPLFVTQSRHDHLNGALFPIGNLALNSYVSTIYETEMPLHAMGRQISADTNDPVLAKVLSAEIDGANILNEVMRAPYSVLLSPFLFAKGYLRDQAQELKGTNLFYYFPNTLAQLPGLEIPIQATDPNAHTPAEIGRHKGLFDFGYYNESIARSTFEPVTMLGKEKSVFSKGGIYYLDAQQVISHGIYGNHPDYKKQWYDFTVGWTDPMGAHDDYNHKYISELIYWMLHDEIR